MLKMSKRAFYLTLYLFLIKVKEFGMIPTEGLSSGSDEDEFWDEIEETNYDSPFIPLNKYCEVDVNYVRVSCSGMSTSSHLPTHRDNFHKTIRVGIFSSLENVATGDQLVLEDIYKSFPRLESLSIVNSSGVAQKFLHEIWLKYSATAFYTVNLPPRKRGPKMGVSGKNRGKNSRVDEFETNKKNEEGDKNFSWPSVRVLNLSGNELTSSSFPYTLLQVFPNLNSLILTNNKISSLENIPQRSLNQLTHLDLSHNPLDCTSPHLEWVDRPNITLLNLEQTVCDRPPHQNKPKPILQTIGLIKKVKSECRLNCSCEIDYIWELDKTIYSRTAVNCSGREFYNFPDPNDLPKPTDTLILNNNNIRSLRKFVENKKYSELSIRNLYLENNNISSLNVLETSDWIYTFQVLSLRNNYISDVPVYMLENIIKENKWIYLIDLSNNEWKCNCRAVSTFKVWLLRNSRFIKNVDDVRCERRGEQIRFLKNEDWCKEEEGSQMIELLDILSIFLAIAIFLVIGKVAYDYWSFKKYGKVPWIVTKI